MIHCKKTLLVWLSCAFTFGTLYAQESDFDLSSQRSEAQDVLPVPGKKLDHEGIIINPTPQKAMIDRSHLLDISNGLALKDVQQKFGENLGFAALQPKGVKLTVDFGKKISDKNGVKNISGAYVLTVDKKGISIIGYDEKGAFYGIQTLRQLLESPATADGKLPYVQINDYPDLKYRGVVEGFYGTPWSHAVRLSLIDFYGKFKMNTYLYGPKDDPYHSCPNWRQPYPGKEAENIKELIQACNRNRVDFVWAIHPGQDIQWNEEDYRNLVNKFNWMYDLGVRSFAIFFDDISGEGTNPVKQTELLNRLTDDFVKAKGDVSSMTVCPTDYSKLWANPTPQGPLAIYGATLNPAIEVFWTGDVVCSDLTKETLDWVNSRIKRPAYFWWNYPVTDYARHILMQGPVYGLSTSLDDNDLCGIASNPMEHGEASKLALYGVADYTWNIADYNPIDNWERGLAELMPQAREAYRTFAIHSCDTETGYRRDESWETRTFTLDNGTEEEMQSLWAEFDKVEKAPAEIEKGCTNPALLAELRPWLVEFEKLGTRGKRAIELIQIYRSGQPADFWSQYIENVMSAEEQKNYESHKSGTMKLQPFYENAMNDMALGFLTRLLGEQPVYYKGIGSFRNMKTTQPKLMFDNDTVTYYTSAMSQKAGDWIGVDLGRVIPVSDVSILQGRNSVDDVDYFDHAIVEYSENGTNWTPLTGELTQQYVICWAGEPVNARYVRLKRLDSKRENYAAVRSFTVNALTPEKLGFQIAAEDMQQAVGAFDRRLDTSYLNRGSLSFEIPAGTNEIIVLNKPAGKGNVTIKQLNAHGDIVSKTTIDTPYYQTRTAAGTARISIEGETEIFEIITLSK
ncbi:MAG: beta-N-acetylglucosaminidase domain-containing protein [Coprobacter sp.]|nr:beta-N-acetylglucosaminidase domain-containing protein [Coprobacter sp.]